MNTKNLIAAAAATLSFALLGGNVLADEVNQPAQSSLSRTQVQAELSAARSAGKIELGEAYGTVQVPQVASGLSRAAVVAELNRARNAGELDNTGETYGYVTDPTQLAIGHKGLTRAQVQAEATSADQKLKDNQYIGG